MSNIQKLAKIEKDGKTYIHIVEAAKELKVSVDGLLKRIKRSPGKVDAFKIEQGHWISLEQIQKFKDKYGK